MRCDDKQILKKYFCNNENKELLLKIFKEDIYNSFMDEIKKEEQNIENTQNVINKDFYNDDTIIKKVEKKEILLGVIEYFIKKIVMKENIMEKL